MRIHNNTLAKFISRRRWMRRLEWFQLPEKVSLQWNDKKLFVTPNDWNGPSYHALKWGPESYEKDNINFLCQVAKKLPKGSTFLDVGANAGIFSFALASQCSNLNIHAFEPEPSLFQCLSSTFTPTTFPNVSIHQLATSDKKSTAILYSDKKNHGAHTLVKEQIATGISNEYQIQTITLDEFIAENNIQSFDLMKMDIQGHEGAALKGASKVIEKFKPIVLMECFKDELLSLDSPILSAFANRGYKTYIPLVNKTIDIDTEQFAEILKNCEYYLDVAFVPEEKLSLIPNT